MSMQTLNAQLPAERLWSGVRRYWRVVRVVGHIFYGLALAAALRAFWLPYRPTVRRQALRWQQQLLALLGVEVERVGLPDPEAGLVVANHISWLDIPVLGAHQDVHFLSKAEVRDWPLIGGLANAAGTLFIRRGSGESRSKASEIAGHIRAGRRVLVFPEGTTTNGRQLRRFFSPLFQAAVEAGVPVQPVVVQYLDAYGRVDVEPAFIGDDEFHLHLWRLLRRDCIRVRVLYLPSLDSAEAEWLCQRSHSAIQRHLPG